MLGRNDTGFFVPGLWDDFVISSNRARQGVAQKPDYDYVNLGLLFPQNDPDEIAYFVAQMPHAKKLGTQIHFHVHYVQNQIPQPIFKIDYRFYNNGAAIPGSWTTISTNDGSKGVFEYPGSGSILQIASFPYVNAPENENVSANIDVRFYREDNNYIGDCLVKYMDFHLLRNSEGSRAEFQK